MKQLPAANTPEWETWRNEKIGASDIPIIMEMSTFQTPLQLWKRKVGFDKPLEMHEGMKRGHIGEIPAREDAQIKFGVAFHPIVLQHPNVDWAISSLDGLSECKKYLIEIKVPNEKDHETAKNGKVPDKYYPQIQWQIYVTKANFPEFEKAFYVSRRNDKNIYVEVEYDDDFVEKCFIEAEYFYNCLVDMTPPPPCERDHVFNETPQFENDAQNYKRAKYTFDEAKKQLDYYKDRLISQTDDGNTEGAGIRLTRYNTQGKIDWEKVVEHYNLNKEELEKFRKPQIGAWRITIIED